MKKSYLVIIALVGIAIIVTTVMIYLNSSQSTCVEGRLPNGMCDSGKVIDIGRSIEISEAKAILLIKEQYPELTSFPSDGLPPKVIRVEKSDIGWHVMFETLGSGIPIIEARCFLVDDLGIVTKIREYKNTGDMIDSLSVKTCLESTTAKPNNTLQ
jgi:hypothetical protein